MRDLDYKISGGQAGKDYENNLREQSLLCRNGG